MAVIGDLMITETITARPDETVLQVSQRMSGNQIGAVLIVDAAGLRGLFSERDLLERVVAEGRDPAKTAVGDVATDYIIAVDVNTPVQEVLRIFREKRFRHMPVTREGRPAGILSTRDFLAHLVGGLEEYIEGMKYRNDLADGVDPYDHIGGAYSR